MFNNLERRRTSFAHGLFMWAISMWMVALVPFAALAAETQVGDADQNTQMSVNNRSAGFGIDPSTACSDVNQDQTITSDECQGRDWSWTATDPQVLVNTQNGVNVPAGSSRGTILQDTTSDVIAGPHFTIRYYNKPRENSTATAGVNSTPNASAALRDLHNEYGFDIIVDKKTDPLEPYYQRFSESYTVDSQQDANGNMVGQAGITYEKIVTEEDPNTPGVFNRYTVTGTATSGGNTGNFTSQCQSGCPAGPGGVPTDPETGWSHPWQ